MAKIPRVPVENQITTLSVVKIAIKFSPCRREESNDRRIRINTCIGEDKKVVKSHTSQEDPHSLGLVIPPTCYAIEYYIVLTATRVCMP